MFSIKPVLSDFPILNLDTYLNQFEFIAKYGAFKYGAFNVGYRKLKSVSHLLFSSPSAHRMCDQMDCHHQIPKRIELCEANIYQ